MINLLELFGLLLICLIGYLSWKEHNVRFVIFGFLFFPIAIIWESLSIGTEWNYTAPVGADYSVFLLNVVPLAIPLGWALSAMLFSWASTRLKRKNKARNLLYSFSLGFFWGLILELFFVNAGYWVYLKTPQIFNIRPSAPVGWGLLALMCFLLYNRFLSKFESFKESFGKLFTFFLLVVLSVFLWILSLKLLSAAILDPLFICLSG